MTPSAISRKYAATFRQKRDETLAKLRREIEGLDVAIRLAEATVLEQEIELEILLNQEKMIDGKMDEFDSRK